MGRWAWAVVACLVGLAACGDEALESRPTPTPNPRELHPEPPDAGPSRLGEYPEVQARIPRFHLRLDPANLQWLEEHPLSDTMVPVEVELDGHRARGLIRYRGASTRELPQKSYKIELAPGEELGDRDHFNLLAHYNDGGKLAEKFAVDLFTALGLPVPRARYVTVSVNGTHQGLFLDMEHVGKDYLAHHALERDASVYRCGHRNCELTLQPGPYQADFEKKTQETTGREDLDAFLLWVNRSDDADFEAKLASRVDLEAYLGNLAADALISNVVLEDSRSYWIHEPHRDTWTYVPWDLNNARLFFWRTWLATDPPITTEWPQGFTLHDPFVQRMWEGRVKERPEQRPTWSVLATRIWERPALRARLLAKLEAALTSGPFTEARAHAHVDALWRRVRPELERDPYRAESHLAEAPAYLQRYVRERRAYLLGLLEALEAHGGGPLVLREVSAGSSGYVELYNRGTRPLDLGRYAVTKDLRSPLPHRLAGGTLRPGESLRLLADGTSGAGHLPFTLSHSGGEVGIFDATRTSPSGQPLMYGPEDALWYGPLPSGTVYGRKSPDSEDFERRPAR